MSRPKNSYIALSDAAPQAESGAQINYLNKLEQLLGSYPRQISPNDEMIVQIPLSFWIDIESVQKNCRQLEKAVTDITGKGDDVYFRGVLTKPALFLPFRLLEDIKTEADAKTIFDVIAPLVRFSMERDSHKIFLRDVVNSGDDTPYLINYMQRNLEKGDPLVYRIITPRVQTLSDILHGGAIKNELNSALGESLFHTPKFLVRPGSREVVYLWPNDMPKLMNSPKLDAVRGIFLKHGPKIEGALNVIRPNDSTNESTPPALQA